MFEGLFQPMHLLVILGIAILVFGPKKIPDLGKGLGEGIRGFKAALQPQEDQVDRKPSEETHGTNTAAVRAEGSNRN